VPRGRIVKDETLGDLAATAPKSQSELAKVRGLSAAWASNDIGRRLMKALEDAEPMTPAEMPTREVARPGLSSEGALIADLLKLLLKIRAKEANVAPKLIARGDELDAIAGGVRAGLTVLGGWRFDVFGKDALALIDGRLGFTVKAGRLTMTATE
jgi:ribonuclease D